MKHNFKSAFLVAILFGFVGLAHAKPQSKKPKQTRSRNTSTFSAYVGKVKTLGNKAVKTHDEINAIYTMAEMGNIFSPSQGQNSYEMQRMMSQQRSKFQANQRPFTLKTIAKGRPIAKSFARLSPVPRSAIDADRQFSIYAQQLDSTLDLLKKWAYSEDYDALDASKETYNAALTAFTAGYDILNQIQSTKANPKKYVTG